MSIVYDREDFDPVPGVPGKFYCPACNRHWDDYGLPACGRTESRGVCGHFGTGSGSLTADGVEAYLASVRPSGRT